MMGVIHGLLGDYAIWPDASLYVKTRHEASAREGNPALLALQGIRFAPHGDDASGATRQSSLPKSLPWLRCRHAATSRLICSARESGAAGAGSTAFTNSLATSTGAALCGGACA